VFGDRRRVGRLPILRSVEAPGGVGRVEGHHVGGRGSVPPFFIRSSPCGSRSTSLGGAAVALPAGCAGIAVDTGGGAGCSFTPQTAGALVVQQLLEDWCQRVEDRAAERGRRRLVLAQGQALDALSLERRTIGSRKEHFASRSSVMRPENPLSLRRLVGANIANLFIDQS
jgi:hypothetical protein